MRSPFPGMDPYIEACELWEDFHQDLIIAIKAVLAAALPDRYVVRAGERSYIVLSTREGEKEHRMQPDLSIVTSSSAPQQTAAATGPAAVLEAGAPEAAPVTMRALVETEYRETFLEIREVHPQRKLITCLEILSPSNKRFDTPGWIQYHRKRQAFLEGSAHFVEIDLLRGGKRLPMEDAWPDSPYYLLVSRREAAPRCTVWPAHFLRTLPTLPIPLAAPDPDLPLDLQPLIDTIYARSRYDRDIDYRQPLHPALGPTEAAWLEAQLRQRAGQS